MSNRPRIHHHPTHNPQVSIMKNDIDNNFTYHPPKEGQPEIYEKVRAKAKEFAELIEQECPSSRELSVAMTNLETSVFWANAAIARHGVILIAVIASMCLGSAFAADDAYKHAPLQLLNAKIAEHDQQICDLDERLNKIEAAITAKEAERDEATAVVTPETPAPVTRYDYDGVVIVPGSERTVERTAVVAYAAPRQLTPVRTVARAVGRRLRTTAELSRVIRSNRTNRVYATISPDTRAWAITHLVNDHGYRRSQVGGLNYADAWMLHNLAHRTSLRISEYTSGAVGAAFASQPADFFTPTPTGGSPAPTPTGGGGGCPGGRCPTSGGLRASSGGWYPGKLLFGR